MSLIQYRKYRPQAGARVVIDQANLIIAEAEADGWSSMTLRQLYYQFVSRGFIPNQVNEYKRLGRIVTDARYGGLISWTAIEDAGRNTFHSIGHQDKKGAASAAANALKLNPWVDQDTYVEVWVEKQALEATIARPASALRAPYMACKGYLSASEAWRANLRYQDAISRGKRPVLLHLGDHDPSGIDMTRDNDDRLYEFLDARIEVRRIALNMDQVEQYDPPPNPAKEDDSRFKGYTAQFGDSCWELDALRQNVIGEIITENLRGFIDQEKWDATMRLEEEMKVPLRAMAARWNEVEQLVGMDGKPLNRLMAYDGAIDMGQSKDTIEFLDWVGDRLVHVHGESENVDFVLSLRERTEALKNARTGEGLE